ncbi:hypothetical protein DFH07DRAFT_781257 [Mycena maculata]|uniref:Uncharacterized protein n=1 Tax=Mycena maculata TaxID=230809 RepID=A0AAD7I0H0_9AGAR|nr:hypothetical protein DFH07DRAFT_781257 [Mycena maculata]
MSSGPQGAPKSTRGGYRAGSGHKPKEWHEARRREATEQRAEEIHVAAAGQQSQPLIQAPSNPVQPVSIAPFFDRRSNTRGIALQDPTRRNSHPNHGLQVHSDLVIESNPPGNHRISKDSFDRLVEELRFLDLNDPNGDITSGENPIEDSLFDEIADDRPNATADAAAATEETQKLQPPETSVHHKYLQNLRSKTTSEIAIHGQPDFYSRGQLFHYAKHPLFAVQDAIVTTNGFKPDSLYHLDVLIWIPHLLAKGTSLKCECGMDLIANGNHICPVKVSTVILLHVVFADDQQTTFCSQIGTCVTTDDLTTPDVGRPTKALMFISLVNCLGLYSLLFLYTSLLGVQLISK